jgi:hypothetical protein
MVFFACDKVNEFRFPQNIKSIGCRVFNYNGPSAIRRIRMISLTIAKPIFLCATKEVNFSDPLVGSIFALSHNSFRGVRDLLKFAPKVLRRV